VEVRLLRVGLLGLEAPIAAFPTDFPQHVRECVRTVAEVVLIGDFLLAYPELSPVRRP
jgi:hypothetical protein